MRAVGKDAPVESLNSVDWSKLGGKRDAQVGEYLLVDMERPISPLNDCEFPLNACAILQNEYECRAFLSRKNLSTIPQVLT